MSALKGKLTPAFVDDKFGSRRACVSFLGHQVGYSLGAYRHYLNIDWSRVDRLVFLCRGNICRSPLGEYAARSAGAAACSAGLSCGEPRAADPRAIDFAVARGLPLDRHLTMAVQELPLGDGDLIVGMEPVHLAELMELGITRGQRTLLGLWCAPRRPFIADPFCANIRYFHYCEELVVQGAVALAAAMRQQAGGDNATVACAPNER